MKQMYVIAHCGRCLARVEPHHEMIIARFHDKKPAQLSTRRFELCPTCAEQTGLWMLAGRPKAAATV